MSEMDRRIDPRTLLEHAGWLKRLARSLVGDEDRAEDLVQQTWVATLKSPLRHPGAARAWLATVVRNFAFQARREERQRRKREASASRQELTTSTPDAAVERAELQKLVVDAVLELDGPYRTTVILRYFDELSLKEIAERQEIPVETVRTRLR